jgi:hypothetical protein
MHVCAKCEFEAAHSWGVDAMLCISIQLVWLFGQTKFKCNQCNRTLVKLVGGYGKWPTPEFNEFTIDQQQTFFQNAAKIKNANELVKSLEAKLTQFTSKEFSWANGGQFLPLAVWQTQGFDVELIKSNTPPEDVTHNPQVGTCYRVKIYSTFEKGNEGQRSEQTLSQRSSVTPPPAFLPIAKRFKDGPETSAEFYQRTQAEKMDRKALDKQTSAHKQAAVGLDKMLFKSLQPFLEFLSAVGAGMPPALLQKAQAVKDDAVKRNARLQECIQNPETSSMNPDAEKEVSCYCHGAIVPIPIMLNACCRHLCL